MSGSPPDNVSDDDRIDPALFARYIQGDSGADDVRAVERWASTPERMRMIADARRVSAESGEGERAWKMIATGMAEVRDQGVRRETSRQGVFSGSFMRRTARYAAISLVLVVMVFAGRWTSQVQFGRVTLGPSAIYTTGNGQRANITLPDGSTVALNVASRLEVPSNFTAGNRVLRLSGEAMFTVRHRAGTQFMVITSNASTRVLGTNFVVRQYASDAMATVAVQSGKVAVGSTVVTAGEQADVRPHGVPRVRPASSSQFTFPTGVLTLRSVPLPEAIVELDRWYDADIRLGDPTLAAQHVTGDCAMGSLTDLQNMLELTYNVRVVRDGRKLTLYQK